MTRITGLTDSVSPFTKKEFLGYFGPSCSKLMSEFPWCLDGELEENLLIIKAFCVQPESTAEC